MNSSTDYVINWTMPQCVLCLRLIGVTIDVYDGTQPEVSNKEHKNQIHSSKALNLFDDFSLCNLTSVSLIDYIIFRRSLGPRTRN